jgi:hypothetical protein
VHALLENGSSQTCLEELSLLGVFNLNVFFQLNVKLGRGSGIFLKDGVKFFLNVLVKLGNLGLEVVLLLDEELALPLPEALKTVLFFVTLHFVLLENVNLVTDNFNVGHSGTINS